MAGCRVDSGHQQPIFSVDAKTNSDVPHNVILKLHNRSGNYICIPVAEVRLGSPIVSVEPPSLDDYGENRPPPVLLGGLDVGEGLHVLPPRESYTVFLNISDLNGRSPPAKLVHGQIRAVGCKDLFGSNRPTIDVRPFQVLLDQK
jgi:hypothetical protein